jgi:hypothetical protein
MGLDHISKLIELLTRDDVVGIDDRILGNGPGNHVDCMDAREMTRLVYVLWQRWVRQDAEINHKALKDLVRRSGSLAGESRHLCCALDYLLLWAEAIGYARANDLKGRYHEIFGPTEHVTEIHKRLNAVGGELSTEYGLLMFDAMLASTSDRAAAASLFQAANAANPGFAKAALLDQFASTYFSSAELRARAEEIEERRRLLLDEFQLLSEPKRTGDEGTLFLFSCDPVFFAIYLPYWISLGQYLLEFDVSLHFVLACDDHDSDDLLDRGQGVIESTARLRGVDPDLLSSCLSFSRTQVPEYVKDRTTFYACARYLVARRMAERFNGRLLVLDVDMTLRSDPRVFFQHLERLPQGRLPMMIASGVATLIPTRRYMAGTFPVPEGELGEWVMQTLEAYVYAGLSSDVSGTLDQNALAYVAEETIGRHGPDALVSVGSLGQPFVQLAPVKQIQEAGQRKLES